MPSSLPCTSLYVEECLTQSPLGNSSGTVLLVYLVGIFTGASLLFVLWCLLVGALASRSAGSPVSSMSAQRHRS